LSGQGDPSDEKPCWFNDTLCVVAEGFGRRPTMRIACVIPALNEEPTIGRLVSEARKHCDMVLVVDDNSQDRTAELSRQNGAEVIRHLLHLGTGGALSTGLRAALRSGFEVFVTMDGDGQHNPNEIPLLLNPILKDEADIAIGSRLIGQSRLMPLRKRIGNKILSTATSLVSGVKITDSQSGFRAYRRKALEYAIHKAWDYRWASEILVLTAKGNFRIKEVPVTAIYSPKRQRGAGITDGFKILYATMKRL
jgi:glycosyltransferase involved in cell wall biosynthesis